MKHLIRLVLLPCLLLCLLPTSRLQAQQPALYFPPAGTSWATTTPQSLGWCSASLDSLLHFLGRKGTKSFLVLKDGRLVVEQYYGTFTQDSVWYWASAGKSLTAMLVGLAQQDGLLSVSDSATRYLGRGWSRVPAAQERLITLRHLLTMTSGLDDTPPLPCDNESSSASCLFYQAPAGTRWAYHTGAYRQLQPVVVRASGLPLNQFTNQKLGSRIGMTGGWLNDVYYSRARDMARFGLLVLARGSWNGTPILRDTAYFRQMTTPSQSSNRSYGYLWWLNGQPSHMLPGPQQTVFSGAITPTAPPDMIAALGKNDQKIYVVPSLNLVVVRQGASAGSPKLALSSFDTDLWRYLMAAMQCRPLATTSTAPAVAFQLAPNPAGGTVSVHLPAAARGWLYLHDALGREVQSVPVGEAGAPTTLSLTGLAAGVYAVQWRTPDGYLHGTRRLIVE